MKAEAVFVGAVAIVVLASGVAARSGQHAGHAEHESAPRPRLDNPGHRGPKAGASSTPTPAFDAAGRLWIAWVDDKHVFVSSSADRGRSFAAGTQVTREPEDIDANGESRPKIAIGTRGDVYVSWTRLGAEPFTGDIRFARSTDSGKTFSAPVTVNDDKLATGHRFDSLHVNGSGDVYLAWIDKRDLVSAVSRGREYHGAALYYARSTDRGQTFSPNHKIKDSVCECCRLAIDFDGLEPVVFWRDVIDGTVRDHGILRFVEPELPGPPRRVTHDGWTIDACPHHGPSLSIAEGTYHLAWFTGVGPEGSGVFYARSTDQGRTLSNPIRVTPAETIQSGHAIVLSRGRDVFLAWKEFRKPVGMTLQAMRSKDSGETWSSPVTVAQTRGASDHPLLLTNGPAVYVSWFTADEGYRLMPVPHIAASHSR